MPGRRSPPARGVETEDDECAVVIAPGEKGMFVDADVVQEIRVRGIRCAPDGLMYELVSDKYTKTWMVRASAVVLIKGVSRLLRVSRITAASRALGEGDPDPGST